MTTRSEIAGAGAAAAEDRQRRARRLLDLVHGGLILLLVLWRPLASGMTAGAFDNACWNLLPGLGILLCCFEATTGLRQRWRWSWTAIVAALFVGLVAPACLGAVDPAAAAGDWLDLVSLLALAVYLVQVLPGRERLCLAALAAALAVHLVLALVQRAWILPALADEQELRRLFPRIGEHQLADLLERTRRGGVYTTFRLANGLAMFLAMAGILLGGSLWRSRLCPRPGAIAALVLLSATGATYLLTGAKGAAVAAVAAAVWVVAGRLREGPRWSIRGLGAAGLAAVVLVRPDPVAASIAVREGYARAAWGLIWEAPWGGHGWGAFAAIGGRHLPLGAEFSKNVHNAWLEMAVAAGIPVALLLAGLMLGWLVPPRRREVLPTAAPAGRRHLVLLCAIPLLLAYVTCFGTMVSDNLALWTSRGDDLPTVALLGAALGVPALAVALAVLRLPPPPRSACRAAVGAFCLGCLVDFHFAEPALAGTAVIAACLATVSEQPLRPGPRALVLPLVAAVGLVAVNCAWMYRLLDRRDRTQHQHLLGLAASEGAEPAHRMAAVAALRQAYPAAGTTGLPDAVMRSSWAEAERFPLDTALALRTAQLDRSIDLRRAYEHLRLLADRGHLDSAIAGELTEQAFALGRPADAVHWARRRVALQPGHLGFRYDLAELLRRLLPRTDDPELRAERRELLERTLRFIATNWDRAHFRERREVPTAGPARWDRPVDQPERPLQVPSPSR